MKLGNFSIYLALFSTLVSAWYYFQSARLEKVNSAAQHKKTLARQSFYLATSLLAVASVYLWYLILTHHFQVDYVSRYTSRDLGLGYLISAFWAGQEGSFLFWTFMTAIMGLVFMRGAREYESYSMFFLNIVQAAFIILLIKASPFALLDTVPPDGAGLNPLLQNPWMVVHPPVLFLGYAATTLPFVIALAALFRHDFKGWVKMSFPWVLFASLTLGAGIIIGAFWAYEVLGWGGYWGWDPVENSSLIAWMAVLALFHGLIITRRNNALQKTNLSLAVSAFSLVLYATFLTRSGVLADFSVHSFQDLGINGYLTVYIIITLVFGFALIYKEKDHIPYTRIDFTGPTKENGLLAAMLIISASAFFILVGTSSPLLTKMVGNPSQVDISFYNQINLPIAILMALLLGFAPDLGWKGLNLKKILSRSTISLAIGLSASLTAFSFGMHNLLYLLFLAAGTFALSANLINLIDKSKRGWKHLPSPLTHLGVSLLFIGIIISGVFDQTQRVVLTKNIPGRALDYELTYQEDFQSPDGKNGIKIVIKEGNKIYHAQPRLYQNDYTRSVMREPYVKAGIFRDIYISPLQRMESGSKAKGTELVLGKGETKKLSDYDIRFDKFEMSSHEETKAFRIAALLKITYDGKSFDAAPAVAMAGKDARYFPAVIPAKETAKGQELTINLAGIDADKKQIKLVFSGLDKKEQQQKQPQILVEVSKKPFMSLLWMGTVLLTLGTFLAIKR